MLTKLAAWYLSKRKVSVIIGFDIKDATIKAINNNAFIYNNRFREVDYRNHDNTKFLIPEGKFTSKQTIYN